MWLALMFAMAMADPDPARIDVAGDGACLVASALVERTQAWAGWERWPTAVAIRVEHGVGTLRIRVDAPGVAPVERTFSEVPPTCHDVELMAAVAIAMAVDQVEHLPAPVEPAMPRVAPTIPASVRLDVRAFAVRPTRPRVALVAAIGGASGAVPLASIETALGLRIGWDRFAIVGELELGARRRTAIDGGDGVLGIVRVAPALGVCSPWSRGRWSVGLCGLAAVGSMLARTRQTLAPRTAVVPWAAAIVRSEVAVELSPRWSLVVRSDLVIGLVRPRIVASGTDGASAWATPRFGWRGGLAARVQLGRIATAAVKRAPSARMEGGR